MEETQESEIFVLMKKFLDKRIVSIDHGEAFDELLEICNKYAVNLQKSVIDSAYQVTK